MSDEDFRSDDETPLPDANQVTVDASSQKSRRRQENRIEREKRESDAYWRAQLNDPVGRRELWRIACDHDGAHAFETRFASGPTGVPNEFATWHAKGEQDFGLRLYHKWLLLDPAAVAAMHQENDPRFARKPKAE
jgi:hypothetical protein